MNDSYEEIKQISQEHKQQINQNDYKKNNKIVQNKAVTYT